MRANEDFGGHRVIITRGQYRSKKGFVSHASKFGIFVTLDYKPLRIEVKSEDIAVLLDNGEIDKK